MVERGIPLNKLVASCVEFSAEFSEDSLDWGMDSHLSVVQHESNHEGLLGEFLENVFSPS